MLSKSVSVLNDSLFENNKFFPRIRKYFEPEPEHLER